VSDGVYVLTVNIYTTAEKANVSSSLAVTGTATLTRFDKVLGNRNVVTMEYATVDENGHGVGDLLNVIYTGDNGSTVYYRDVLGYTAYNLTSVKHYHNTASLVTASGTTSLSYTSDALTSTSYTEV
jgi:hypothetical protein